jgi:nucleotide-binding universal stress UspA family protein
VPAAGRVIAGVSGSPGSLRALRCAEGMARARGAALIPVLAWVPPGGDSADRYQPSAQLRQLWHDAACQRLDDALAAAWGDIPPDLTVIPHVERGPAGWVLVSIASQHGDLLVIGAGRRGWLARLLRCKVPRYCAARARCPVVLVPPPELVGSLWRLRLTWAFGRRPLTPAQVLGRGGTQTGNGPVRT